MNKTQTKSSVLLKHHLKALKLPTMHAECEKIAQRCAADNADRLTHRCHILETKGESYRLQDAKRRRRPTG